MIKLTSSQEARASDRSGDADANARLTFSTTFFWDFGRLQLASRRGGPWRVRVNAETHSSFCCSDKPSASFFWSKKPRKVATSRTNISEAAPTTNTAKPLAARGYPPGSRDEEEANRHKVLLSSSNCLGGSNLQRRRWIEACERYRGRGPSRRELRQVQAHPRDQDDYRAET